MRAFEEFLQYKTRVPVRGAILLNEAMDATVLVKGWKKGANWSFPRGKINKDEDDLDCAIREVYEETGFDIREAGLVPKDDEVKYIQISMREQQIRLYVFRNVPMDTVFQPKTRKEISKVQWWKLSDLPAYRKKGNGNNHDDGVVASSSSSANNKFYMVAPFLVPLKKWIAQQKRKDAARAARANNGAQLPGQLPAEEGLTEDDLGAQTEPVPEEAPPSNNGTPAIETLEGATLELQRLLKVQPPTQGLQVGGQPSGAGKAEALMALLQKKTETPGQTPQPQRSYDYPTGSDTPQRVPGHADYNQPPASFPIPSSAGQPYSSGYYKQDPQPAPRFPEPYSHNPFTNQGRDPPLLHPQPMLPQSILTRSILQTPNLPDLSTPSVAPTQQGVYGPPTGGGYGDVYGPQQPPQQPLQPVQPAAKPQLSAHALSLLNAFKSGSQEGPSAQSSQPASSAPAAVLATAPGPGPWSQAQPSAVSALPYLSQHLAGAAPQMQTSPRGGADLPIQLPPKPAPPTDAHRSALLDMFKRGARSPGSPLRNEIKASSFEETVALGRARERECEGEREGTGSGSSSGSKEGPGQGFNKQPSAAEAIAAANQARGGPVQMNPEVMLPYRAVEILTRPKQQQQHHQQQQQQAQQAQVGGNVQQEQQQPQPPPQPQQVEDTRETIQRLHQRIQPPGQQRGRAGSGSGVSPRERKSSGYLFQQAQREQQRELEREREREERSPKVPTGGSPFTISGPGPSTGVAAAAAPQGIPISYGSQVQQQQQQQQQQPPPYNYQSSPAAVYASLSSSYGQSSQSPIALLQQQHQRLAASKGKEGTSVEQRQKLLALFGTGASAGAKEGGAGIGVQQPQRRGSGTSAGTGGVSPATSIPPGFGPGPGAAAGYAAGLYGDDLKGKRRDSAASGSGPGVIGSGMHRSSANTTPQSTGQPAATQYQQQPQQRSRVASLAEAIGVPISATSAGASLPGASMPSVMPDALSSSSIPGFIPGIGVGAGFGPGASMVPPGAPGNASSSAVGGSMSRRASSQTTATGGATISQADRNFLLSYLESVTGGSGR